MTSKSSDILDRAIAEGQAAAETAPAAVSTIPFDQAGIGHNKPPQDLLLQAEDLVIRLGDGYAAQQAEVTALLSDIGGRTEGVIGAPEVVETDADNGIVAAFMERLRTSVKIIETLRVREKAPYLKAERAIDQYFGGMLDRLTKTQGILQARGNRYVAWKAEEERRRRIREAEEAAEKARQEREAAELAARQQAELEAAAARARKPENIERLESEAAQKAVEADTRDVGAMVATDTARQAATAAAASTADLVRTRYDSGHMGTGKQVGYVEIDDYALIDLNQLRPYFKQADILKALGAWAKTQDYKCTMPGARIGKRDEAAYR